MVNIQHKWAPWLALKMVRGIGNVSYRQLLARFSSPQSVFAVSFTNLTNAGLRPDVARAITTFQQWNEVEQELEKIARHQVRVLTWAEEEYPGNLRQIHDPPPFFYVRGEFLPQDCLAIALVGSRAASAYGRDVTRELAMGLAEQGITIVSGLARGIDAQAHAATLAVKGRTIAVLGSGLDIIYPSEHKSLAEAIAGGGAVVSEFGMGSKPAAVNFPYRNRVISGLALGTVVVEATEKSGSLITIQYALDQGREVFAVPGNVSAGRSRGTNRLIKQGAKLVENVEDILDEIAPALRREEKQAAQFLQTPLVGDAKSIFCLLTDEQMHVDTLITKSGLSPARVLEVLLGLELKGLVTQLPGKHFAPTTKLQAKA
jgi:DNA processing protein